MKNEDPLLVDVLEYILDKFWNLRTPEGRHAYNQHLLENLPGGVGAHLATLREKYEQGDRGALFSAISTCASAEIPIPRWAADAFSDGWGRYCAVAPDPGSKNGETTLGGAFGIKRLHPEKARTELLAPIIDLYVRSFQQQGRGISKDLYDEIADRLPADGGAKRYKEFFDADLPKKERKKPSASTVGRRHSEFRKKSSK